MYNRLHLFTPNSHSFPPPSSFLRQLQVCSLCLWICFCLEVHLWSYFRSSLVARMVKHLPTMRETRVWSSGWEDPLEKAMATHSSTLAWKIPWTVEHGRLQSMGSQRVGHNWETSLSLSFCKWCHMVLSFSVWLTPLRIKISRFIPVSVNGVISFLLWLSNIPLYVCTTSLSWMNMFLK